MEEAILNTLNPQLEIREASEAYLKQQEQQPDFFLSVLEVYRHSSQTAARLSALLLLKNTIPRRWTVFPTSGSIMPFAVKEQLKQAVLAYLLEEPDAKLQKLLVLCIALISRHEFYDAWPELTASLRQTDCSQPSQLLLLDKVLKIQMNKMIPVKKRMFAQYAAEIFPNVKQAWMYTDNRVLTRAVLKLLTVVRDPDALHRLLSKAEGLLLSQHSEEELAPLVKGLTQVHEKAPAAFEALAERFLGVLGQVITQVCPTTSAQSRLFSEACKSMYELLTTEEALVSSDDLQSLFLKLMNHPLWQLAAEQWLGTEALDSADLTEEYALNKLRLCLLKRCPTLVATVQAFGGFRSDLSLGQLHSLALLFGILPRVPHCESIDLNGILASLFSLQPAPAEQLLLFKDALWIIRKWARLIDDLPTVYTWIKTIKASAQHSQVVFYECCKTLKALIQTKAPVEVCQAILEDFGVHVFSLVLNTAEPQVIWNLVTLVSAAVQHSADCHALVNVLKASGLSQLFTASNEMVRIALAKMFEELLKLQHSNPTVVELVAAFLLAQNPTKHDLPCLWHFLLANMAPLAECCAWTEQLRPFLSVLAPKTTFVKVYEEYLFLYNEMGVDLGQLLIPQTEDMMLLTGESQLDSVTLSLHQSIALVNPKWCLPFFAQYQHYFRADRTTAHCTLCTFNALLVVDQLLVLWPEALAGSLDLEAWLQASVVFSAPNHKLLHAVSMLKVLPCLPRDCLEPAALALLASALPALSSWAHGTSSPESLTESRVKVASSQMVPSLRKGRLSMKTPTHAEVCQALTAAVHTIEASGLSLRTAFDESFIQQLTATHGLLQQA